MEESDYLWPFVSLLGSSIIVSNPAADRLVPDCQLG